MREYIHTICLIAMSIDFFEMDLPKPPFSEAVDVLIGFLIESDM